MYYSLKGKVEEINKYNLILNVHDVCYELLCADISTFKVGEEVRIFTHLIIKEEEQYLVGFSSLDIKKVYLLLTSLNGIGPKTTIKILNNIKVDDLLKAINDNNVYLLTKIPGIGNKFATTIISSLRNKIKVKDDNLKDIKSALSNLGFKVNDICFALSNIDTTNSSKELILKEALKKLNDRKR